MFLTQLKSLRSKHQKSYATIYQLFENLVLHPIHLMLYKDWQFVTYMEKYNWAKIKIEIDKLISSLRLQKQATNVSLENFESFSYIKVVKKY